jgi:hypothetical protein
MSSRRAFITKRLAAATAIAVITAAAGATGPLPPAATGQRSGAERSRPAGAGPQASAEAPASREAESKAPQYKGADYCSGCHSPSADNKLPRDWVTLDEFPTWEKHDKHRHAYEALACPRAKQIERLMGMPADKPATKDERCLACHALDLSHGEQGKLLGESGADRREAAIAQGVSCEVCHGASSRWFAMHAEPAEWRDRAADRRSGKLYDEFGMTNLRDPIKRTELCLSCHLGDISAGKFVTHEMFAAGHPPLPAFEIETFMERMPRHWRLDSERKATAAAETDAKKRAAAEKLLELNGYQPFARSQATLLQGLVALRASMKLLADQTDPARQAGGDANPHLGLAEFALYDCATCHHELKLPSERQSRGYFGAAPGRPPLKYWSMPLAQLAASGYDSTADLNAILAPLHAAVRHRPFGDPATVHQAAADAIAQLDLAITALKTSFETKPVDSKSAIQLARQLCDLGAKTPLDIDSAQVLIGALDSLAAELKEQQSFAPTAELALDHLKHFVRLDRPPVPFSCELDEPSQKSGESDDFDPTQFGNMLTSLAESLPSH